MTKKELFYRTIDAWLEKDAEKLLATLSENILYTECYGARYKGKKEVEKWFCHWTEPVENSVKSWTVHDAYFDGNTGFFPWTFHCVYNDKESIFDGISLVKFEENQIIEIQEFEQKHEKFRPYHNEGGKGE